MPVPWIDPVRKSNTLTVYNGIEEGSWAGVFKYLTQNFHAITHKLVKIVEETDMDKANVVLQLSDGDSTYTYDGTPGRAVLVGTKHGATKPFQRDGKMEKAASFLPRNPEDANINYLRFIALHEMLHASGFTLNSEHSNSGLFASPVTMQFGKVTSSAQFKSMPPFYLADKTKAALGSIW